jgi:hypothetical protein
VVDRCPPVETLPEIAVLPLDGEKVDPRRRHLASCPRCQARLADYRDFMAGGTPCPPRELHAAMASLDAALRAAGDRDAALGAAGDGAAGGRAAAPRPAGPRARVLSPVFGHPLAGHPLARVGFALAALFLLLVALDALPERPRQREIRLRAGEGRPSAAALVLEAPRLLADGSLEFAWQALPGADDYRLRLLAPDLALLAERPCGGATLLRLAASELDALHVGGGVLVWQVEARAGGDPLALSPPATFSLPDRP